MTRLLLAFALATTGIAHADDVEDGGDEFAVALTGDSDIIVYREAYDGEVDEIDFEYGVLKTGTTELIIFREAVDEPCVVNDGKADIAIVFPVVGAEDTYLVTKVIETIFIHPRTCPVDNDEAMFVIYATAP